MLCLSYDFIFHFHVNKQVPSLLYITDIFLSSEVEPHRLD
jgi:hypothetical protein